MSVQQPGQENAALDLKIGRTSLGPSISYVLPERNNSKQIAVARQRAPSGEADEMAKTSLSANFVLRLLGILLLMSAPTFAQSIVNTPSVPLELPVEIETELAPAGSLKQAPLWHEIAEVLEHPTAINCPTGNHECFALTERRRSFRFNSSGAEVAMPRLQVFSPCYNPLTGQPIRLRTSDGEISWDQPGPLFGPDDDDPTTPVTRIIGRLVARANGNLVLRNPSGNPDLPPDNTVVAKPGCNDEGDPINLGGIVIDEFETPISELDFLRPTTDTAGVSVALRSYIGRPASEILGKALFWDMQVGSDSVQACGTCHASAGVDHRTKNQLNPNHLGGDTQLSVHAAPDGELVPEDFPFRKLGNPDLPSEGDPNQVVVRDSNDVMSSMGVRFRKFGNIPPIGTGSYGPASAGIKPLLPDLVANTADAETDPIPLFQGLRRVEPRNTPTINSAAFNFDNFWDGRARHDFNGGSTAGPSDPQFHLWIDPGGPNADGGNLQGARNRHFRPVEDPTDPEEVEVAEQPVRIRFSSLASLATGPALSDFEMSFAGRNWPKIGKKLLQGDVPNAQPQSSAATQFTVTPLANQLVDVSDSILGAFSNQGGSTCNALGRAVANGKPGLCISYGDLIRMSFIRELWQNTTRHLDGSQSICSQPMLNGRRDPADPANCDPFDGYVLANNSGTADPAQRNDFRQIEANFSFFFGMSVQIWQQLLIPDDTPFDRFMDRNPLAANAVAQPGEQGTLPPNMVAPLVGPLDLIPNFGEDEIFGFDIFAGANLTAALPLGSKRNPTGEGSNPFLRTARCMLCHLGPEQTDHTNNVNAGLLHSDVEFELPPPGDPEPTGVFRLVSGAALAEEVEENAQDGVEVENRNFAVHDDPNTPWDDRVVGVPNGIAFQDNGVYNIGVRPTAEDIMRGGLDPFGWPLSLAALALKNLGGRNFEPCDHPGDSCVMSGFDRSFGKGGGLFEETGADQRINPGLAMEPSNSRLPDFLAPWANNLPAGELHPEIDELAFAPNTRTEPPFAEFGEILFSSDTNCALYDPAQFGNEAPNFGWGPRCPNSQSAIPNNFDPPANGTWPVPNRVARLGAVKAPQLRNVELTGPYFHTGSYLTLRQVVDFYMRGGDFPVTNAEDRDPNLVNVGLQAFGFGTTIGLPPQFMDGIPDQISQYEAASAEFQEDAKEALVKFLLALTDARVRFERAPFDHPEIIVPVDGTAPDNTGGRAALLADPRFKVIPAVGAEGNADPIQGFLGVSRSPKAGPNNDHFDR